MDHKTGLQNSLTAYFAALAFIWIAGIWLLITMGYEGSFLYLNGHFSSLGDAIMPHLTQLGDSLILSSLILIFIVRKHPALAFSALISVILSGIVLLLLKYFLFADWHRPLKVLGEGKGIHFISGYVEYYRSFPSGHTTTIASAFPLIAFLFRNKLIQVMLATMAILVVYSRIYLGSHFLGDVLAGIALGSIFAVFSLYRIYPRLNNFLNSMDWYKLQRIQFIAFITGILCLFLGLSIRYVF